jgi:hypothetical protein
VNGAQTISPYSWSGLNQFGFVSGMFWSEIAMYSMEKGVDIVNYWSAIEGNTDVNDIGFISRTNVKRSSYYHFKELSSSFNSGNYVNGTYVNGTGSMARVRAFGSVQTDRIVVVLLNENVSTTYNGVSIYLGWSPTSTPSNYYIKVNAGLSSKYYVDTIYATSSTIIVFDKCGNVVSKKRYKQSDNNSPAGFQTVWAATNPSTTSISLGADQYLCCTPSLNKTLTATPSTSGHYYSWYRIAPTYAFLGYTTTNTKSVATSYGTNRFVVRDSTSGCVSAVDTVMIFVDNGGNDLVDPGDGGETSRKTKITTTSNNGIVSSAISGIMPNPSSGIFEIDYLIVDNAENAELVAYDLTGRQVYRKAIDQSSQRTMLDLSKLANGVYSIKLTVNGNVSDSEKVVIAK